MALTMTPQKNYLNNSNMTTTQSIIATILANPDTTKVMQKFNELQQLVHLTEIEKQIIKEVNDSINTVQSVNPEYIINKFSYFFQAAQYVIIPWEQLDYAILDKKVKEDRNKLTKELLQLANDVDTLPTLELKQRISELTQGKLITQTQDRTPPKNGLHHVDDAIEDLTQDNGVYSMLLPEVEEHAGKAGVGHVISILAFVGSFKSTYALQMAYKNALEGTNVLYLSLESTAKAMVSRMVVNHIAETTTNKKLVIRQKEIKHNELTQEKREHYNKKHNELVTELGNNFILWDSTDIKYGTYMEMTETLRLADKQFKETTGKGLEMIYLDQLALLKYTDPSGTNKKYGYAGAIMDEWMTYFRQQSLNFLGESRQVTSVVVSQVRREAYAEASKTKNKGRYDASAGGDSNEIERTSDTIITLYKDLDTKNTLLVHVPKARHGSNPDKPIQVEVYGDYFHVGPLDTVEGDTITMDDFMTQGFSLQDLMKQ